MSTILEDLSAPALVNAIEENAIEGCKAWRRWPGLELHDDPGMVWTLTDVPFAIFNGVFRARIAPDDVDRTIEATLARVRSRNLPMMWWTGPSTRPAELGAHLQSKGFRLAAIVAGMAVDLPALDETPPTPRGLSIEEVRDVETLATWCRVVTRVFGFPDFAAKAWFDMHAAMGLGPELPWRHYLGRLDGEPVATASLFSGSGVASIASVATVAQARRRGIGAAVSLKPLSEARRMGYRIGTLCSSVQAEGVYRKLGFREYCRMGMFLWAND